MGNAVNSSRTALMFYEDEDEYYAGFSEVSDIVFIDTVLEDSCDFIKKIALDI